MSADNYYLVRRHPNGGFAAVMGFASEVDEYGDEIEPTVNPAAPAFPTVEAALASVIHEYAEYGHSVHEECYDDVPEGVAPEGTVVDSFAFFDAGVREGLSMAADLVRAHPDWGRDAILAELDAAATYEDPR